MQAVCGCGVAGVPTGRLGGPAATTPMDVDVGPSGCTAGCDDAEQEPLLRRVLQFLAATDAQGAEMLDLVSYVCNAQQL